MSRPSAVSSPASAVPPLGGRALAAGLENAIRQGTDALLALQKPDGHWVFELEADATIPAEYILLDHFLGTLTPERTALHERMAVYLRSRQSEEHGGWPLFHGGAFDISASVKAYLALKSVGDDPDSPSMARARASILAHGGAARSNVFTRIQLALFGFVPWRAVPVMPVEIVLLPRWFPFHLSKVSYWSRVVIVPLVVLMALKPLAKNPKGLTVEELFLLPPAQMRVWPTVAGPSLLTAAFRALDVVLRRVEPWIPKALRAHAINRAMAWVGERLNGEDGLGAIYPAMANALMAYTALGYAPDHPQPAIVRKAIDKLVVDTPEKTYCQPCVSPVWDTGLALHALLEAKAAPEVLQKACTWLAQRQILDVAGDWAEIRPDVAPGGWAFQYANAYYPDLDDTAMVVLALDRTDRERYRVAMDRGVSWVLGLQSTNGGWGAFDADNTAFYLNAIPFADHGALLDPPTADVTGRCLSMLGQLGFSRGGAAVQRAVDYLRREQEPEGCWFGRWGTNYIYGTWSVLCALNAVGVPLEDPAVRKAVAWLYARQQADGGWGESGQSYWPGTPKGEGVPSTPAQTAWALLGLMAAGEVDNPAVARGVAHLQTTQNAEGLWDEEPYTAVGFPRVFYLRYHGYRAFFPLWALARYRNLTQGNATQVMVGL